LGKFLGSGIFKPHLVPGLFKKKENLRLTWRFQGLELLGSPWKGIGPTLKEVNPFQFLLERFSLGPNWKFFPWFGLPTKKFWKFSFLKCSGWFGLVQNAQFPNLGLWKNGLPFSTRKLSTFYLKEKGLGFIDEEDGH